MTRTYRVAGISGSLRKGSYNTATLRAAQELAPGSLDIDIVTLDDTPLFNEDVEAVGWPDRIQDLRERVQAADAVIFAAPEYNYSIAGVLKNAIDWLSRPEGDAPLNGKPAAIVGATPAFVGTARGQAHLRQVVFYNAMPLLPTAEVLIARAGERFDDEGQLTDEETRAVLKDMLEKFAAWVDRHA
ncbi:NAD(P)H-dependent oxidoreductase [Rhodovulum sp. 12E13]|uniref:NADPH-dependent FMN reductase n=1 Tax=Rhodovulum sp. 12E13 TaxID=2203891 RepID=UPI000E17E08F|nr:NAD(P)H-dependent oxidoreductase [Rhodovulum sp. 12E13]RDC72342.1 NAD(P)H-dependent oxidoreductase [Rhodovulum sp. 12E13]